MKLFVDTSAMLAFLDADQTRHGIREALALDSDLLPARASASSRSGQPTRAFALDADQTRHGIREALALDSDFARQGFSLFPSPSN